VVDDARVVVELLLQGLLDGVTIGAFRALIIASMRS